MGSFNSKCQDVTLSDHSLFRTFAAGNKIKQFYELLVENSLRREDVETMSRENMKNLHEIMQVRCHLKLFSLVGTKSIKTKPDPSLFKVLTLSQNIHEIFFNWVNNIQNF